MSRLEYLPFDLVVLLSRLIEIPDILHLGRISSQMSSVIYNNEFWEAKILQIRPLAQNLSCLDVNELINLYKQLTRSGKLYTLGINNFGKLGLGEVEKSSIPQLVNIPEKIIQVSLGHYHTGCVTDAGKLYMWGSGSYGKLGLGDEEDHDVPVPVPNVNDVLQVSCGDNFTAFITQEGKLYTFGHNGMGQLGQLSRKDLWIPTQVEKLATVKIVQISCGLRHMGAVDNRGKVYLWGSNDSGELGRDHTQYSLNSYADNAVQISCGAYCTLILNARGEVYATGSNAFGRLGLGKNIEETSIPIKIQDLPFINQISGGLTHSAFLTTRGTVYVCGQNSQAELGLGDFIPRYFPQLVVGTPNNIQVSCGNNFTALITNTGRLRLIGEIVPFISGLGISMSRFGEPKDILFKNVQFVSVGYGALALIR